MLSGLRHAYGGTFFNFLVKSPRSGCQLLMNIPHDLDLHQ